MRDLIEAQEVCHNGAACDSVETDPEPEDGLHHRYNKPENSYTVRVDCHLSNPLLVREKQARDHKVMPAFRRHLSLFEEFLKEIDLGDIRLLQCG